LELTSEVNQSGTDMDNELWLPPVSIWEIIALLEKGAYASGKT
jgi:PIN domain nuclease of toxin-antitoxin system